MADDFILDSLSDMDPYDREERCRKTIRTLLKAILMRAAAGILLIVAVVRSEAAPVALGLSVFVLLVILAGVVPLVRELQKQTQLLRDCLARQKETEDSKH